MLSENKVKGSCFRRPVNLETKGIREGLEIDILDLLMLLDVAADGLCGDLGSPLGLPTSLGGRQW